MKAPCHYLSLCGSQGSQTADCTWRAIVFYLQHPQLFRESTQLLYLVATTLQPDCAHENCIKIAVPVHLSVPLPACLSLRVELQLTQPSQSTASLQPGASSHPKTCRQLVRAQTVSLPHFVASAWCDLWVTWFSTCCYTEAVVLPVTPPSSLCLRFKHPSVTSLCFHFVLLVYFWWLARAKGHTMWIITILAASGKISA